MQIHSGRFKGQRIKTVKNFSYRPTQSIVRKSLFDTIEPLNCKNFLDLFSGTGIIGFEAASRGVNNIFFVDKSIRVYSLLKINSSNFSGINFRFSRSDGLKFIKSDKKYDIIFADPPYEYPHIDTLIKLSCHALEKKGRFILESSKNKFMRKPNRQRKIGDSYVSFWNNE